MLFTVACLSYPLLHEVFNTSCVTDVLIGKVSCVKMQRSSFSYENVPSFMKNSTFILICIIYVAILDVIEKSLI